MAPMFCLRLAWGLIAAMLLLPVGMTPPRFFRVQYLISLGLLVVAGFFLGANVDPFFHGASAIPTLLACVLLCALGSIVWHIEGAPLARPILKFAVIGVFGAMFCAGFRAYEGHWHMAWRLLDDISSAALLGSCTSAMLMGHSYLIAPAMSLTPLLRLLAAMAAALGLRVILAGVGLWRMHEQSTAAALDNEMILLLSLRWGLGFAGVLGLGWMSWESARIRSTQSATGILYVVVIFCFLGELCSQLLELKTGLIL
jgi:hypothetical protein